ncbi:MAG: hypothetical protein DLM52_13035 [Chthoniobacterales bacterium]|nr:MAG: hypothetical protein DLM52_13035 [Chthoniobacterales bacterium]
MRTTSQREVNEKCAEGAFWLSVIGRQMRDLGVRYRDAEAVFLEFISHGSTRISRDDRSDPCFIYVNPVADSVAAAARANRIGRGMPLTAATLTLLSPFLNVQTEWMLRSWKI